MSTQCTAIKFDGVKKTFPNSKTPVFNGIDLSIPSGRITFLLGPSGSGKSVMFKHIVGLLQPDAGAIEVFGEMIPYRDPAGLNSLREKFGVLFQGSALFDNMTVFNNVAFPLRMHRRSFTSAKIRALVEDSLRAVDLDPSTTAGKYPAELSGGMRKRVALARAIILEPEILLYDEPTTGLDPITRVTVEDLIVSTNRKYRLTSVIISHDIAASIYLADMIAFINEGRIIFSGAPSELPRSEQPIIKDFLKADRRYSGEAAR